MGDKPYTTDQRDPFEGWRRSHNMEDLELNEPGVVVELTLEEAEALGIYPEDALTLEDALAANADLERLKD